MHLALRLWTRHVSFTTKNSFAYHYRVQRLRLLSRFLANREQIKILDIGGTADFWTHLDFDLQNIASIVLFNLTKEKVNHPLFASCQGNATDLSVYKDQQFDVVLSNSVIEHVESFKKQQQMAKEIRRVGKSYFIQTPNKWFPIEPHFVFPFFQLLPITIRALLLKYFNLGSYTKGRTFAQAVTCVKGIRLLSLKELMSLFPKAKIYKEKVLGLTKSYILYSPPECE